MNVEQPYTTNLGVTTGLNADAETANETTATDRNNILFI